MASLAYQAASLRIYSVAPGVSCAIQCSPWCSSVVGEAQRPPPGIGFVRQYRRRIDGASACGQEERITQYNYSCTATSCKSYGSSRCEDCRDLGAHCERRFACTPSTVVAQLPDEC